MYLQKLPKGVVYENQYICGLPAEIIGSRKRIQGSPGLPAPPDFGPRKGSLFFSNNLYLFNEQIMCFGKYFLNSDHRLLILLKICSKLLKVYHFGGIPVKNKTVKLNFCHLSTLENEFFTLIVILYDKYSHNSTLKFKN